MNWEKKITALKNLHIKRIRRICAGFSASFSDKEVPLNTSIPEQTGYCRRPIPYDYLYVYGKTIDGKEKHIDCGLYSDDLLKKIEILIGKQ